MKIRYSFAVLLALLIICCFVSCKKKQAELTELEKLPAATQTGANTFGALVNGQAFLISSNFGNGAPYQCNYIYYNGGYNFLVSGSFESGNSITEINIGTLLLPLSEGQTIKLTKYNENGMAFGEFYYITQPAQLNQNAYHTTTSVTGELHITKLDPVNQIVAGIFFFDAISGSGNITHVTDGRFDMRYTR